MWNRLWTPGRTPLDWSHRSFPDARPPTSRQPKTGWKPASGGGAIATLGSHCNKWLFTMYW